ncbi:hypothetical protein HN784_02340 [bacterium]|jgi:hypothetical protein|nr:hypothetical protein [bacterium]MBT4251141.1 hypothetical protein [bacterium]MBT4598067.1 hypothetical protein [bacterium]MBT6753410.1 hypothetical protein [bacterium]MBT7038123.1 hypothetical protein [bacterium]
MRKRIEKFKETFHAQSFIAGIVAIVFLAGLFVFVSNFSLGFNAVGISTMIGEDKVASIMKDLVENNLTKKGTDVAVENVEFIKELGLYEVKMKLAGKAETSAFLSRDGKYFVKEAASLEEIKSKREAQEEAAAGEAERKRDIKIPKTKKPNVEVFVMSHCPFGTQVQKGFLPVIKKLGSKADINFKFVDYLMHGKKELTENLNQYCIEQEENKKYLKYLECFLGSTGEASDSTSCMKEFGISEKKIASCSTKVDEKFLISKQFADKTTWQGGKYPLFNLQKEENDKYKVGGSPTIVINGVTVEPNRDPKSLLKTVCSAFEEAPKECEEVVPSQTPSPGFGIGKAPTVSSDGGCEE